MTHQQLNEQLPKIIEELVAFAAGKPINVTNPDALKR